MNAGSVRQSNSNTAYSYNNSKRTRVKSCTLVVVVARKRFNSNGGPSSVRLVGDKYRDALD